MIDLVVYQKGENGRILIIFFIINKDNNSFMKNKKLNRETIKAIKEAYKGINTIGPFKSVDEFKATLKK